MGLSPKTALQQNIAGLKFRPIFLYLTVQFVRTTLNSTQHCRHARGREESETLVGLFCACVGKNTGWSWAMISVETATDVFWQGLKWLTSVLQPTYSPSPRYYLAALYSRQAGGGVEAGTSSPLPWSYSAFKAPKSGSARKE